MTEPIELIPDDSTDRFIVRECDGDEGCIVIEQFVKPTPDTRDENEPLFDLHIPDDIAALVGRALIQLAQQLETERA